MRENKKMKRGSFGSAAFQDLSDLHTDEEGHIFSADEQSFQIEENERTTPNIDPSHVPINFNSGGRPSSRTSSQQPSTQQPSKTPSKSQLQFEELTEDDDDSVQEIDRETFQHNKPHRFHDETHTISNPYGTSGGTSLQNVNPFSIEEHVESDESEGEDENGNRYVRTSKVIINEGKNGPTQQTVTTKKVTTNDGRVITTSSTTTAGGNAPFVTQSSTTSTGNGGFTRTTTTSSSSGGFGTNFNSQSTMGSVGSMGSVFDDPFFSSPFSGSSMMGRSLFDNDPFFSGSMFGSMFPFAQRRQQPQFQQQYPPQYNQQQFGAQQPFQYAQQQPNFQQYQQQPNPQYQQRQYQQNYAPNQQQTYQQTRK